MPEEINRLVTDGLADLLLTPDLLSSENLQQEGVPEARIRFVGKIMIDTLEAQRNRAEALDPYEIVCQALLPRQADLSPEQKRSVKENRFAAMTMHRPELWEGTPPNVL